MVTTRQPPESARLFAAYKRVIAYWNTERGPIPSYIQAMNDTVLGPMIRKAASQTPSYLYRPRPPIKKQWHGPK